MRAATATLVFGALCTLSTLAVSQTVRERMQRGDATVLQLNNGLAQSTLERMRQEFPFLAEATRATRWATCGRTRSSTAARGSWRPLLSSRRSAKRRS